MSGQTVRVPAMFFQDWVDRLGEQFGVSEDDWQVRGRQVVARLSAPAIGDLLADARYYADTAGDWWDESVRGLNTSARRTVAALTRQGLAG